MIRLIRNDSKFITPTVITPTVITPPVRISLPYKSAHRSPTIKYPTRKQTTHYFLFYYNEDIRAFRHPNITPVRLNEENAVFFESRGFLQIDINSIPVTDNIGFLTPSMFRKSRVRSINDLFKIPIAENTIVGFYSLINNTLQNAKQFHSPTFIHLWKNILTRMNYAAFENREFRCSFSNLWVTKRAIAIDYIHFIRSVINTIKNTTGKEKTLIFSKIDYTTGRLSSEVLKQRTGYPHYTYHAFLCERMIGAYAMIKNINFVSG